jgi:hypothetical protein
LKEISVHRRLAPPAVILQDARMNADGFIKWALDDARTVEERYPVELLVEIGVGWWNSRRKIYKHESLEKQMERKRQRALNPAYEPHYSETDLRHAAEAWAAIKSWWFSTGGLDERPIRDVKAFAFFTHLEEIHMHTCEVTDVSVFAGLPNLRVLKFGSKRCEDLRPLARCVHLRALELTTGMGWWRGHSQWPDVTGLEKLVQLERLSLVGNLLVFQRGIAWPNVRQATLRCEPLPARCLRDLPQLPACEFLTLGGVERLDGIEAFPRLRNLKLETDARDFTPLAGLDKLTCFTCGGFEPVDISPLARLPRLQVATFDARYQFALNAVKPRDFAALAGAPALRELHVPHCPPVEAEVRTLNSLLLPWDDVWLAEKPRPLPPALRLVVAPWKQHPQDSSTIKLVPEDGGLPDAGLRECEGRWVGRLVEETITAKLGPADWGKAAGNGAYRTFSANIESFAAVEKLPQIIEAMREVLTRLRYDYTASFMIALKSPRLEPTPAQVQLEKQFRDEQDQAGWERRQQEQQEYLERLHRYELKKQLGEAIKPEDFVPPPPTKLPPPPWEREDEEDEDDNENSAGDLVVKQKPDPPPSWFDDEHPLADNYRLMGTLTLLEVWFMPHQRDLAVYLMGRQPDLEIPEEQQTE